MAILEEDLSQVDWAHYGNAIRTLSDFKDEVLITTDRSRRIHYFELSIVCIKMAAGDKNI